MSISVDLVSICHFPGKAGVPPGSYFSCAGEALNRIGAAYGAIARVGADHRACNRARLQSRSWLCDAGAGLLFSQLCEGFVSFASLTNHQVQCHGLAPEFIEVRDEAIPQVGQMPSADEAEVSQVVDRRYQSLLLWSNLPARNKCASR